MTFTLEGDPARGILYGLVMGAVSWIVAGLIVYGLALLWGWTR